MKFDDLHSPPKCDTEADPISQRLTAEDWARAMEQLKGMYRNGLLRPRTLKGPTLVPRRDFAPNKPTKE
jgi:hypothetical protein